MIIWDDSNLVRWIMAWQCQGKGRLSSMETQTIIIIHCLNIFRYPGMLDDPYNFVDDDDSMQKPLQGQAMHPFTPNGYNMSQQSSQQHQSIDYSNPLATQSSAAPTPDKNVKKRGRKKKGDEIRYVCVKLLRHKCIRIYNITRTHTCTHTNVTLVFPSLSIIYSISWRTLDRLLIRFLISSDFSFLFNFLAILQ